MANTIAIIGGGPAGLMAAETLADIGHGVTVYEAMPTFGRKFLLAGKSGLNLTHSEDFDRFAGRFGEASAFMRPQLRDFSPDDARTWALGLGSETFVGSSGRVFPREMKASPLLRAWLKRLAEKGVQLLTRRRWTGFEADALTFSAPDGEVVVKADATLLALGGASWPRLGSNGAWAPWLAQRGVNINPFRPANCGFDVAWSAPFREKFAGAPLKSVSITSGNGETRGEFVISGHGVEGSLIYAHAAALRDAFDTSRSVHLLVDLQPDRTVERLTADLARQDAKASFSTRLRKGAGLEGVKAALLREIEPGVSKLEAAALARLIKRAALSLVGPRPIDEAISSAGGIALSAMDENLMLKALPGVFASGEMLDWEAPTGGYLLTGCMASGKAAAMGIDRWLCSQ